MFKFLLLITLVAVGQAGLDSASLLIPGLNDQITYTSTFSGSFWDGAKASAAGTLRIKRLDDRIVQVESSDGTHTLTGNASVQSDGSLVAVPSRHDLASFNITAIVLHSIPKAGNSWHVDIPVQTTDAEVKPVDLAMSSRTGNDGETIISGAGATTSSLTYAQYVMPMDIGVRLAIRLVRGQFSRAEFAASEDVHAGPRSQTMSYSWALAPMP
jgi:hypothetical protein